MLLHREATFTHMVYRSKSCRYHMTAALIVQIDVFVSTKISEIVEALANILTIQPISRTHSADF